MSDPQPIPPQPTIIPTAQPLDYFSSMEQPKSPAQLLVLGWLGLVYGCLRVYSAGSILALAVTNEYVLADLRTNWALCATNFFGLVFGVGLIVGSILCLRRSMLARRIMIAVAIVGIAAFIARISAFVQGELQAIQLLGMLGFLRYSWRLPVAGLFPIWMFFAMFSPSIKRAFEPVNSRPGSLVE